MIVYKQWIKYYKKYNSNYIKDKYFTYEGWFLFGIIPLYIKRIGVKK